MANYSTTNFRTDPPATTPVPNHKAGNYYFNESKTKIPKRKLNFPPEKISK